MIHFGDFEVRYLMQKPSLPSMKFPFNDGELVLEGVDDIQFSGPVYLGSIELDKDHSAYLVIPVSYFDKED